MNITEWKMQTHQNVRVAKSMAFYYNFFFLSLSSQRNYNKQWHNKESNDFKLNANEKKNVLWIKRQ